jgi:hypothetical protein
MAIETVGAKVFIVQTDTGLARVYKPVTIQPKTVQRLEIKVSNHRHKETVLLEPLSSLPDVGLAGAKCVATVHKGKTYMQVLNPTDDPVTLSASQVVAMVTRIDPDSIQQFDPPTTSAHTNTEGTGSTNTSSSHCTNHAHVFSAAKGQPASSSEKVSDSDPFPFNLEGTDLSDDENTELTEFLNKNRDIFAEHLKDLGKTNLYHHTIDTGDHQPVRSRPYRHSAATNTEQDRQLDDMLEAKVVDESDSPWQSPVVMVKKKGGELRFAVEYRQFPTPSLRTFSTQLDQ